MAYIAALPAVQIGTSSFEFYATLHLAIAANGSLTRNKDDWKRIAAFKRGKEGRTGNVDVKLGRNLTPNLGPMIAFSCGSRFDNPWKLDKHAQDSARPLFRAIGRLWEMGLLCLRHQ
jgi:hypothetical protein